MRFAYTALIFFLASSFAVQGSASVMCTVRQSKTEYAPELGGLKSIGWNAASGKAKGTFEGLHDAEENIIPGDQQIPGSAVPGKLRHRGDMNFAFQLPDGTVYLLRAFNADPPGAMFAHASAVWLTGGTPMLARSYEWEWLDCVNLDL